MFDGFMCPIVILYNPNCPITSNIDLIVSIDYIIEDTFGVRLIVLHESRQTNFPLFPAARGDTPAHRPQRGYQRFSKGTSPTSQLR